MDCHISLTFVRFYFPASDGNEKQTESEQGLFSLRSSEKWGENLCSVEIKYEAIKSLKWTTKAKLRPTWIAVGKRKKKKICGEI